MRRFLRAAADLFLPPACIACHRSLVPCAELESDRRLLLCEDCTSFLQPFDQDRVCPHCGMEPWNSIPGVTPPGCCSECGWLRRSFRSARSAFPYDSPAGQIVRNMKYHGAPWLAPRLVDLALPSLSRWFSELKGDTQIIPVPMFGVRELKRGFNQAAAVAEAVSERTRLPIASYGTLVRARKGKPQARFHTREERMENLEGAFLVRHPERAKGKKFLIVDDVMTTGATVTGAAEALLAAGADQVDVFTPVRAKAGADNPLLDPVGSSAALGKRRGSGSSR